MFKFRINGMLKGQDKRVTRAFETKNYKSNSKMLEIGFEKGFRVITSVDYYSNIYECWLHVKNR